MSYDPMSPLAYMNFDKHSGERLDSFGRVGVTPLMSNPGVYEMHQTQIYNNYGMAYDSHITTKFPDREPWRHTLK